MAAVSNSARGKVTALAAGTARITAGIPGLTNSTTTTQVTVTAPTVVSIAVTPVNESVPVGISPSN